MCKHRAVRSNIYIQWNYLVALICLDTQVYADSEENCYCALPGFTGTPSDVPSL